MQWYWKYTSVFTYSFGFGRLAITIFYEQTAVEYSNSRKPTTQLRPLIKNQIKWYTVDINSNQNK